MEESESSGEEEKTKRKRKIVNVLQDDERWIQIIFVDFLNITFFTDHNTLFKQLWSSKHLTSSVMKKLFVAKLALNHLLIKVHNLLRPRGGHHGGSRTPQGGWTNLLKNSKMLGSQVNNYNISNITK